MIKDKKQRVARTKDFPLAVIVELEFLEDTGQSRKVTRLIDVPITYKHHEEKDPAS